MSLSLRPVQDSSLYGGKLDLATPTKSWKSAPIVKALLTHLQNAPSSSEEQGHQHCEDKRSLSLYLLGLRKTQLQTSIVMVLLLVRTASSCNDQEGLGSDVKRREGSRHTGLTEG